jgi:hypothetical protein
MTKDRLLTKKRNLNPCTNTDSMHLQNPYHPKKESAGSVTKEAAPVGEAFLEEGLEVPRKT